MISEEHKRKIGEANKRHWARKKETGEYDYILRTTERKKKEWVQCNNQYWREDKYVICKNERNRKEFRCINCQLRPHKKRRPQIFCNIFNPSYCIDMEK